MADSLRRTPYERLFGDLRAGECAALHERDQMPAPYTTSFGKRTAKASRSPGANYPQLYLQRLKYQPPMKSGTRHC